MIRAAMTILLAFLTPALAATPPATPAAKPSAPATPAPAKPPPKKPPPPAAAEHIHEFEATTVLGKNVIDAKGQEIGRIINVLVDQWGKPRAAVIDFGGFMGVGSRRIAVAWRALHFTPDKKNGQTITLDMTPDQIKATPAYKGATGAAVTVAAPPGAAHPTPPTPPVR
jgi:hypothetical protein